MAFVRKRRNKFCVVYKFKDENNKEHQKSETYGTQKVGTVTDAGCKKL